MPRIRKVVVAQRREPGEVVPCSFSTLDAMAAEMIRVMRETPGKWMVVAHDHDTLSKLRNLFEIANLPSRVKDNFDLLDCAAAGFFTQTLFLMSGNSTGSDVGCLLLAAGIITIDGFDACTRVQSASSAFDALESRQKSLLVVGDAEQQLFLALKGLCRPMNAGWMGRETLAIDKAAEWLKLVLAADPKDRFWIDPVRKVFHSRRGTLKDRISEHFADEQVDDENSTEVLLLTCHASKGLERPFVWLVDQEEAPYKIPKFGRVITEQAYAEENRRLYYVAITRAMERLVVAWTREQGASTFTRELFYSKRPSLFFN